MVNEIRALVLGDVVGTPGIRALFFGLKKMIKEYRADLVVVNGENAASGFGMMPDDVHHIFEAGADIITSGNHIWQKKDVFELLDSEERLLRPANYPPSVPGHGICIVERKKQKIAVINLLGLSRMVFNGPCPFLTARKIIHENKADAYILDFHAEDPMEKEALSQYLDGQISLLYGTHTHVQTADERILPGGCGYITDIGMVGPLDSVIGSDPKLSIERSLSQMPIKMKVLDNDAVICGIFVVIKDGKTSSIKRIRQLS